MSTVIVNRTLPLILKTIEQVLVTYPHHPQQQFFANPDKRQALTAYVLTRMYCTYDVADEAELDFLSETPQPQPSAMELYVESLVHQGINAILCHEEAALECVIPEEEVVTVAVSHWFG